MTFTYERLELRAELAEQRLAESQRNLHITEQSRVDAEIAGRNALAVAVAAHEWDNVRNAFKEGRADYRDYIRARRALSAACDATTPSPTRTHTVVAVAELERMRDALRLIAGGKCENYTGGTRCWDDGMGRTRGALYSAEAWCDACIAQDALNGGAR